MTIRELIEMIVLYGQTWSNNRTVVKSFNLSHEGLNISPRTVSRLLTKLSAHRNLISILLKIGLDCCWWIHLVIGVTDAVPTVSSWCEQHFMSRCRSSSCICRVPGANWSVSGLVSRRIVVVSVGSDTILLMPYWWQNCNLNVTWSGQ